MAARNAGSAFVKVRPDASDFVRDLRRDLAAVRDPGFVVSVTADTADAARDTAQWRAEQERNAVELEVEADTAAAAAHMDRWRREEESRGVGIDVEVDTVGASSHMAAWRAEQGALQIKVDVDTSALQRSLGGLGLGSGRGFSGGGGGRGGMLASLIPLGTMGALGSLPALGSIVADVTAGVQQLASAGLVLPGVIGGIATTAVTAKVGFTGMSEALEAVNAAADGTPESLLAAEEALKKLSPAAADVIRTVSGFKPQWDRAVRDTFQQNMFEGLNDDLQKTFDELFPVVESGLGDVSSAWNSTFAELLSVGGSNTTKGFFERLFGNTADAQRIANDAIAPMTSAIGELVATGSDSLPRIAYDIDSVAERFDKWISGAAADGRLDDWINDGITGLENLGNSGINIARSIGGISDAASGDLLRSIEEVTGKWADWLNSTEGQAQLKQFIADGDALLSSMKGTVENLGPEFKAAFDLSSTSVGALVTSIEGITTALKAVETALPGFTESFKNALAGPLGMVNQLKSVLDNNPLASDLAQGKLDAALAAARGNDPRTRPVVGPDIGGPAIAAPTPVQGPGVAPTRTPVAPSNLQELLIPGMPSRATGGPVSTTGPALLHGSPTAPEFVQRASAVQKYGLPFMQALNDGAIKLGTGRDLAPMGGGRFNPDIQIDTSHASVAPPYNPHRLTPDYLGDILAGGADVGGAGIPGRGPLDIQGLPKFDGGGLVDEHGNPLNAGPAAGGTVAAPATAQIAPNPTAGGGGVSGIFSQFVSGLQGPIGNALAFGQAGLNMAQSAGGGAGAGGVDPSTTVHGAGAGALPGPAAAGLGGLGFPAFPGITQAGTPGGDLATRAAGIPGFAGLFGSLASPDPLPSLMNWGSQTANWVANWGMETLGSVGSTLWQGALGFFGLENSILSPSNVYNQAAQQTGQFFMGQGGPLGQLLGMGANGQSSTAAAGGTGLENLSKEQLALLAAQNGGLPPGMKLPKGVGSEKGLQINTIKVKRAVSAMFPGIAEIGGVRKDALKWHPNGLAIDVMVPGWDTPEGKAYGDEIYKFVAANADALGVDMGATLWQVKDHYNHLHIATTGGGYPTKGTEFTMPGQLPAMDSGGPTPSAMGPVDNKGGHLAVVHPKEFMISARGRATVPDSFLHALNQGIVDPRELPGYAVGGAIRPLAAVAQPAPRPVVPARTMNPQVRTAPAVQAPSAAPSPSPAPAAAPPPVATPTPAQKSATPAGAPSPAIVAANQGAGGINHNVGWVNQLIESSASNLGQLASTAMSIASMGGGAIPGMGAVGAAGPFVAGLFQQGGKIVEGAVNVVSSALVGSAPGSFGGPAGNSPYGRVVRPEQEAPATASPRVQNNTFNGMDIPRVFQELDMRDAFDHQATLAKHS